MSWGHWSGDRAQRGRRSQRGWTHALRFGDRVVHTESGRHARFIVSRRHLGWTPGAWVLFHGEAPRWVADAMLGPATSGVADRRTDVGRCGARPPHPVTGCTSLTTICELDAGHAGWHRDGTTEWSATASSPRPAGPVRAGLRQSWDCRPGHPAGCVHVTYPNAPITGQSCRYCGEVDDGVAWCCDEAMEAHR